MTGETVTVNAWVKSVRRQKANTFLHVEDGLSPARLQVVTESANVPEDLTLHSAVSITGTLVDSPNPAQQTHEMRAHTVKACRLFFSELL